MLDRVAAEYLAKASPGCAVDGNLKPDSKRN
jgi:hypothetical protein